MSMELNVDLSVPITEYFIRVIRRHQGDIITDEMVLRSDHLRNGGDCAKSQIEIDVLKVCVMNRYDFTKRTIGFVKGIGLKFGAMATSISHDAHNYICVGVEDDSMKAALYHLIENNGGICFFNHYDRLASVDLGIYGLMSDKPYHVVHGEISEMKAILAGAGISDLLALSFLTLSVIPELKITDKGLIKNFQIVPLFMEESH